MKYKRKLVRNEKPFEEEHARIKAAYDKRGIKSEDRAKLKQILDSGMLERTQQVIDEGTARKIEHEVEARVRHEIRSGRLEPAKRDAFMARQEQWEKRRR